MRPPGHADAVALACLIWHCPVKGRQHLIEAAIAQARIADKCRRATGQNHPKYGDGSLFSAAQKLGSYCEPSLKGADYCECLAMVYRNLAQLQERCHSSTNAVST